MMCRWCIPRQLSYGPAMYLSVSTSMTRTEFGLAAAVSSFWYSAYVIFGPVLCYLGIIGDIVYLASPGSHSTIVLVLGKRHMACAGRISQCEQDGTYGIAMDLTSCLADEYRIAFQLINVTWLDCEMWQC